MEAPASLTLPLMLRPGTPALVGREQQLSLLGRALLEARAGRASVVLIAGEPGIGKTRLLDEFTASPGADGATILRGGAIDTEGMPPYLPFREALREYVLATPSDTLRSDLGDDAPVVAQLVPDIGARLGPLHPPDSLGAESDRLRLFDTIATLFTTIAATARGPLVLIFDDLQWADSASCDLLVHVARRAAVSPLLIAGGYREGDAESNPALTRAIAELNRRRNLTTIPLRRLDAPDTGRLVEDLLGGVAEPAIGALVHQHSDGNPFFAEELLRALVAGGQVDARSGRWSLVSDPGFLLPNSVAGAVQMRLTRLQPAAIELLEIAAIAGRSWEIDLLAAVAGRDVEQTETELLPAARARLIRPEPGETYAFTHDKIRETLYAGVSPARRRRLHLRIGEVIAEREEWREGRRLADLAFHFVRAGDRERGVRYAIAAGEDALEKHAWAEAATHFQAAVDLLPPNASPSVVSLALTGLGEASILSGELSRAAATYARLAREAEQRGDTAAAGRAWTRLGDVYWRQEALDDARAAFERAIDLLSPGDSGDLAQALLRLAELLSVSFGRQDESIALAEAAVTIVQRLGDRTLEAVTLSTLGNVRARHGDLAGGHVLLERALALALEHDDLALASRTCSHLTTVSSWLGDLERAWEITRLHEQLAQQTSDRFQLQYVYRWQGILESGRGNWAAAQELLDRSAEVMDQFADPSGRLLLRYVGSRMEFLRGNVDEALRVFQQEMGKRCENVPRPNQPWALGLLARLLIETGQQDEARACLVALEELADQPSAGDTERSVIYCTLIEGYAGLGDPQRAAAYYHLLLPYEGQFAHFGTHNDTALAIAAGCAGNVEAALRHLANAEAHARRYSLRPHLVVILLRLWMIERRLDGAAGRSRAHIEEGLRLAGELGMQAYAERMLAAAHSPRPAWPNGLSDRQVDVLRLVARGMTNQEIAATLSIGAGTVANHLTAIYTKTGVDNRAGAVAFAHRHNLADLHP